MKRRGILFVFVVFTLLISQAVATAAGISDVRLGAIFPGGTVVDNTTLNVPGQGYFGQEIMVTIPFTEKISGSPSEYSVQFYFRRQILDFNREQSETIVEQNLAQFASGTHDYWGTSLGFEEAGSCSDKVGLDGSVGTTTIDPPQKEGVAGGIVWYQRSVVTAFGRQQVYYTCHYAARVGDFVATLDVSIPDSRGQADAWFESLIGACK